MKYIDEFRSARVVRAVIRALRSAIKGKPSLRFMEVCGTHTMSIFRSGLASLLPEGIQLVSGPGCPVCVTSNGYIDKAIALSRRRGVIVTTFGDLLRVPGSASSLEAEKGLGASVKVVYSTLDALAVARRNPDKEVIFLGIGFETTVPTVAAAVMIAKKEGIRNFTVLCGHKTMPEVLERISSDPELRIDGYLLPGHVSTVIGTRAYKPLAARYGKRCVVAGFEPVDVAQALVMLLRQKTPSVEVQYGRIVRPGGNSLARKAIETVFEKSSSSWRGIGVIPSSGLLIRKAFRAFDALERFPVRIPKPVEPKGCLCGSVIKGVKRPTDCPLFGKACTPTHPVGACMVSSEGTCAAYFKYRVI